MASIRRFAPLILLGLLILAALVYLGSVSGEGHGPLTASGTVEGAEVRIGSESGGRVVEVLVDEGQAVHAGDPLFRLDDELLSLKRNLVAASGKAAVASARLNRLTAQQALQLLDEEAPVIAAQAASELANARDELKDAEYRWRVQQEGHRARRDVVSLAEARYLLAEDALDHVEHVYANVSDRDEDDPLRAAVLEELVAAQDRRNDLGRRLNWYTGHPSEIDQAVLDGELAEAQAKVALAEKVYEDVKDGIDPDDLELAQARLAQAQAQFDLAQAQAESELASIDLQLSKLEVRSSVDGRVIVRSIEPGEVLAAGAAAITVRRPDVLTLTVYIPEERYGQIAVGDPARVEVDAFPGEIFAAQVSRIADQAEFTPRNVQTEEGRRLMVFAVELRLTDPDGRLKPGMPADVTFGA
jgi:HlyD family secretion protein